MSLIRNKAAENIYQQHIKDKTYYDQTHHLSTRFDIVKKVLLENASKRYSCSHKLSLKCRSPFYIHEKMTNDAYKLRTLEGKVISSPFNLSLLK